MIKVCSKCSRSKRKESHTRGRGREGQNSRKTSQKLTDEKLPMAYLVPAGLPWAAGNAAKLLSFPYLEVSLLVNYQQQKKSQPT